MSLDEAVSLKNKLLAKINKVSPYGGAAGFGAVPFDASPRGAIGLAADRQGRARVAVLVQKHSYGKNLRNYPEYVNGVREGVIFKMKVGRVKPLIARFKDVSPFGAGRKGAPSKHRHSHRPLVGGISVGHHRNSAGTLGAFVRRRSDGKLCVLSNGHVLGHDNRQAAGDDHTLQPGSLDKGRHDADTIGALLDLIPLESIAVNEVDCAVAEVRDGHWAKECLNQQLNHDLRLNGQVVSAEELRQAVGLPVWKVGRTTGLRRGTVRVTGLDWLSVPYEGLGNRIFNGVVVIDSEGGHSAFAKFGDSGSLVMDGQGRAVGLIFAGSAKGGFKGRGVVYVIPMETILRRLGVELVAQ